MPRIPTYRSQLNAARSTEATIASSLTFMPFVRETERTGAMIQARGEQLLREYDQTRAYNAFNELRNQSRSKVEELLQREGAHAQGVQSEYEIWSKDAQGQVAKDNLTTYSQTDLFSKLADQHRQSDLDRLAGHEVTQHKIYKGEVIKGLANVTERDVRESAFDDAKMDGMIQNYFDAIDGLFPGHDTSNDKLAALQTFRVSAAEQLIDANPKYAAGKLEEWKADLGDKYYALKKRLEQQTADNKMAEAYNTLYTRFGNNSEAAMSWLAIPSNQEKLGLDFKEVNALHNRFSQLLSDRERAESIGRQRLKEVQDDGDRRALQAQYDPKAPPVDLHEMHRTRHMSDEMYAKLNNLKETSEVDNPFLVSDLHGQIERGVDVTPLIAEGVANGSLSKKTAASIGKHQTDEKSKRAMQYIDRALRPSELDRWSPDKNLKYADATRLYYAKVAGGMDYEQAAFEVVKGYVDGVRRTVKMLPTPEGLTNDQKTDLAALEQSKQMIVSKLRSGLITPEVYREQMNAVDNLIKIAIEEQQAGEMDTELQELRKKKLQK